MSLIIKNLHKKFGRKLIFDGLSLEFSNVGAYALIGESGVGKTTLLRIIAGLERDFSGEVTGGGIKSCSIAFQEYRLFDNLCALDNLIFANHDKRTPENTREAEDILSSLGFSEDDMRLFPSELSGGMKQRVSVARSLLRPSEILLLDEPTKELDPENSQRLLSLIRAEAERRCVLIVTHRAEDIDILGAKRIVI